MADARDEMREAFDKWLRQHVKDNPYCEITWPAFQAGAAYGVRQPGEAPGAGMSAETVKRLRKEPPDRNPLKWTEADWYRHAWNECIDEVISLLPVQSIPAKREEEI